MLFFFGKNYHGALILEYLWPETEKIKIRNKDVGYL
jgi:hypothetical protein